MTLPVSGKITLSQIATELGISQTGLSLNHPKVRELAGKPSGLIKLSDLYGKTAPIELLYTLTSGQSGTTSILTGFRVAQAGAISPTTFRGKEFTALYDFSTDNYFRFVLYTAYIDRNFFKTLVINGKTYSPTDADCEYTNNSGGDTLWRWPRKAGLVNGATYPVKLTY